MTLKSSLWLFFREDFVVQAGVGEHRSGESFESLSSGVLGLVRPHAVPSQSQGRGSITRGAFRPSSLQTSQSTGELGGCARELKHSARASSVKKYNVGVGLE